MTIAANALLLLLVLATVIGATMATTGRLGRWTTAGDGEGQALAVAAALVAGLGMVAMAVLAAWGAS